MEADYKTPSEHAKRIIAEFMQDGQFHTTQEIMKYTKSNAPEGIEITEKHIGAVLYREAAKGRLTRVERGTYQWNAEFTGEKRRQAFRM